MHLADILSKSLGRSNISLRNVTNKSIFKDQTDSGRGHFPHFNPLLTFVSDLPHIIRAAESYTCCASFHLLSYLLLQSCRTVIQSSGKKTKNKTRLLSQLSSKPVVPRSCHSLFSSSAPARSDFAGDSFWDQIVGDASVEELCSRCQEQISQFLRQ